MKSDELSETQRTLFSLIGRRVRVECPQLYKDSFVEGTISEFWSYDWRPNRLEFSIIAKDGEVQHAMDKPTNCKVEGDIYAFESGNVVYIFTTLDEDQCKP